MGDISEMMLEGILCQMCGTLLPEPHTGTPTYCSVDCGGEEDLIACVTDKGVVRKTTATTETEVEGE